MLASARGQRAPPARGAGACRRRRDTTIVSARRLEPALQRPGLPTHPAGATPAVTTRAPRAAATAAVSSVDPSSTTITSSTSGSPASPSRHGPIRDASSRAGMTTEIVPANAPRKASAGRRTRPRPRRASTTAPRPLGLARSQRCFQRVDRRDRRPGPRRAGRRRRATRGRRAARARRAAPARVSPRAVDAHDRIRARRGDLRRQLGPQRGCAGARSGPPGHAREPPELARGGPAHDLVVVELRQRRARTPAARAFSLNWHFQRYAAAAASSAPMITGTVPCSARAIALASRVLGARPAPTRRPATRPARPPPRSRRAATARRRRAPPPPARRRASSRPPPAAGSRRAPGSPARRRAGRARPARRRWWPRAAARRAQPRRRRPTASPPCRPSSSSSSTSGRRPGPAGQRVAVATTTSGRVSRGADRAAAPAAPPTPSRPCRRRSAPPGRRPGATPAESTRHSASRRCVGEVEHLGELTRRSTARRPRASSVGTIRRAVLRRAVVTPGNSRAPLEMTLSGAEGRRPRRPR